MKRAGGRRYYRPEDVDLIKGVRRLLHGQGYTIRGAQRVLKEGGVRFVQSIGRGEAEAPAMREPDAAEDGPEAAGGLSASDKTSLEGVLNELYACREMLDALRVPPETGLES